MASRLQLGGDNTVLLSVTHSNIKSFSSEVRFDLEMSVEAVKEKLWKRCGTSVDSMLLELYDDAGSKICDLSDDRQGMPKENRHTPRQWYICGYRDTKRDWQLREVLTACGDLEEGLVAAAISATGFGCIFEWLACHVCV